MVEINHNSLVPSILALQFLAFGWRINREIPVGDAGRKTWFPIPDVINILSMLCGVAFLHRSATSLWSFRRQFTHYFGGCICAHRLPSDCDDRTLSSLFTKRPEYLQSEE